jgi:hypothetical protein
MSEHLVLLEMSCKLCNAVIGHAAKQVDLAVRSARHSQTHHPETVSEILAGDSETIEKYFKLEQVDMLPLTSFTGKGDA